MRSIEDQTEYRFSYNKNIYDTTRMLDLPQLSMHLSEVLDNMIDGAAVKYMVHGRYIALVPANDNSRPQVQQRPTPPRTSDVYIQNDPDKLPVAPRRRPAPETLEVAPEPVAEVASEPEKEQYSDYRPIDIYGDVQMSLPRFGIKIDMLYGLSTLTPNIAAEVALSRHSTMEVSYSNHPWKYDADLDKNKKFLHGIVSLGYRYWFCERYSGHSLGIHALYSEYNISGYTVPILFKKDYRYKGTTYGGGAFYGYALPMGKMWNLEFKAGFDVLHMEYKRFGCRTCDTDYRSFKKTHIVPAAGINIVFLIK